MDRQIESWLLVHCSIRKSKTGSPESRATSPKVTLGGRTTRCPRMPSCGAAAAPPGPGTQGQWHSAPESTHTCGPHLEPQLGASRCRHHCHHRLLGHSATLPSHVPAAASWQASPEPGDANLWQTSEEAISKTAITRKGNKLLLTSETFTHGESAPDKVIRAMCLQSCIIYIEIFHRERSAREIEGSRGIKYRGQCSSAKPARAPDYRRIRHIRKLLDKLRLHPVSDF